jgi:AraC-like DNA-binding protein
MISAACFKISYSLNNIALSLAGAIKIYNLLLKLGSEKQLLENPDLSIMDVAMQSGFPSLPSFNRTFKQTNHCTPSQSRKMFDHFPG